MNLNEWAREIHANAVAHGFWDEEKPIEETMALIHSEWSEALEEYRADRPMYYKVCKNCGEPCMKDGCGDFLDTECALGELDSKPEGIAVELIDGCIRILDYVGKLEARFDRDSKDLESISAQYAPKRFGDKFRYLPSVVGILHSLTTRALVENDTRGLTACIGTVFAYIRSQGLDPEVILIEKHEYNKTRPYKHGKRI